MKHALKTILAQLYRPFSSSGGGVHAPILCYHSVHETNHGDAAPMHPELFEAHLQYLTKHHSVIKLTDMVQAIKAGDTLPLNAVAITFDDGYRDNYETVYPLLQKYNIPATIFLVTGFIDKRSVLYGAEESLPMSWDNIQEMAANDLITFGAHTDSHHILTDLSPENAVEEVQKSCDIITDKLGQPVTSFAYPFGQGKHISPEAKDYLAQRKDMACACSTLANTRQSAHAPYMLNRTMVDAADSIPILKSKLSGAYNYLYIWQKICAVRSVLFQKRGVYK